VSEFSKKLRVFQTANAEYFAADLFWESFRVPFPIPRDECGLSIPTPPHLWHQYVALYKGPSNCIRTVGFCNWIRYGDMYLEGGMCVDRHFYRTLSRQEWTDCRGAGGIAQIIMETAARELADAPAWFGYCGDKQAYQVDLRAGYVQTSHKFLIVKWFRDLPTSEQERLTAKAAQIGPF
jgi:hypothetical protein